MLFTLAQLHPDLLFTNTTPAGGDMGAHVWGPAYLRDHLLPHCRLSGWAPDWYAGFPMYQFYMVLPALAVVLLEHRAALRRRAQARRDHRRAHAADLRVGVRQADAAPLPGAGAVLGRRRVSSCSTRRFTIYGGNIASTMAGEFSFSIALSLALLFFGVFAYGLRTGKHRALRGRACSRCAACAT